MRWGKRGLHPLTSCPSLWKILLLISQQRLPRSRAVLSLLGFCYYHSQNYPSAIKTYEALLHLCPGQEEYKMFYAQALYHAGLYTDAWHASVRVEGPQYSQRKLLLQVCLENL